MPETMWVFGYGSLIWNPEFPVAEARVARVKGWHRSFCMRSIHHRGSETAPGLVLALDRALGSYCDGVAFRGIASVAHLSSVREGCLVPATGDVS